MFFCLKNKPEWVNLSVHKRSYVVQTAHEFHPNPLSRLFIPLKILTPPDSGSRQVENAYKIFAE